MPRPFLLVQLLVVFCLSTGAQLSEDLYTTDLVLDSVSVTTLAPIVSDAVSTAQPDVPKQDEIAANGNKPNFGDDDVTSDRTVESTGHLVPGQGDNTLFNGSGANLDMKDTSNRTVPSDLAVVIQGQVLVNESKPDNNETDNQLNATKTKNQPSHLRTLLTKLISRPSSVKRHMEKNRVILEELSSNHVAGQSSDSATVAFHDEETVAIVTYVNQTAVNCKLMEINFRSQAYTVLNNLSHYMAIYPLDTRNMIQLIDKCQYVRKPVRIANRASSGRSLKDQNPTKGTFISAIVPGTKWCGPGDMAQSYDDLGPIADLDRCCRAHDHCPIKIKGIASAYGLINFSLYTKSHCACEEAFYTCLKNVNSAVSRMVGNIYFNVVQTPCIEEDTSAQQDSSPAKIQILPANDRCQARNSAGCFSSVPKPYVFVSMNRPF